MHPYIHAYIHTYLHTYIHTYGIIQMVMGDLCCCPRFINAHCMYAYIHSHIYICIYISFILYPNLYPPLPRLGMYYLLYLCYGKCLADEGGQCYSVSFVESSYKRNTYIIHTYIHTYMQVASIAIWRRSKKTAGSSWARTTPSTSGSRTARNRTCAPFLPACIAEGLGIDTKRRRLARTKVRLTL